jgi:benzoyl-CoA reductase/2-hydroxyglutaryl-CoA dehydratase subunit BcrC/BadD/HgdB
MEKKERFHNKVESTGLIRGIVKDFYGSVIRAPQEGRKVCWCVGAGPYELFKAMDIGHFQTENWGVAVTSRKSERPMIEEAERVGYSSDVCSYASINIGYALLLKKGKVPNDLSPELRVPKPDFLFCINTCPSMAQWTEALREIFDVPAFIIDVPLFYDDQDEVQYQRNILYAVEQLRDAVTFIEEMTGQSYNWNRLKEIHTYIKKTSIVRKELFELWCHKPSSISYWDMAIALGAANVFRGTPEALAFFTKIRDEVAERIKKGITTVPKEKHRLLWYMNHPWFKVGHLAEFFARHDTVVVGGQYVIGPYADPEKIDPERPLWTIAEEHPTRPYVRTMRYKIERFMKALARDFQVDGIVFHSPRTCRPNSWDHFDEGEIVKQELGLPYIIIEADHTDPQFYSEAEVDNRLQAFIESLSSNKQW